MNQTPINSVAFITVCSGRLHHLRQTLPLMDAAKPDEIIVVDYDCPDRTADWVTKNFSGVTAIRAHDPDGLCVPRGRNIGAANANSKWLCFVDADILIKPGWLDWMKQNLKENYFFTIDKPDDFGSYGTFICHQSDFHSVGGFDEIFRGWGGEDSDMYNRLELSDVKRSCYPARFVEAIQHSDKERNFHSQLANRPAQRLVHHLYNHTVTGIFRNSLDPLPECCRTNLYDQISNRLGEKFADNRLPSFRFAERFDLHCAGCQESKGRNTEILLVRRRKWYLFGGKIWEYSLIDKR